MEDRFLSQVSIILKRILSSDMVVALLDFTWHLDLKVSKKYATGATVCPKEVEMRRKVSAHGNLSRY